MSCANDFKLHVSPEVNAATKQACASDLELKLLLRLLPSYETNMQMQQGDERHSGRDKPQSSLFVVFRLAPVRRQESAVHPSANALTMDL